MSSKNTSTKKKYKINPYTDNAYAQIFRNLLKRFGKRVKIFKNPNILYTDSLIYTNAVISALCNIIPKEDGLLFEDYLRKEPIFLPLFNRNGSIYMLVISSYNDKNWYASLSDKDGIICCTPSSKSLNKKVEGRELFVRIYFDDRYDIMVKGDKCHKKSDIYRLERYLGTESNCEGCKVVDVQYSIFQTIFFRKYIQYLALLRDNNPSDRDIDAYFCRIHYEKGDRGPAPKKDANLKTGAIREKCSIEEGIREVEFYVHVPVMHKKQVAMTTGDEEIHSTKTEKRYVEKTLCRMFICQRKEGKKNGKEEQRKRDPQRKEQERQEGKEEK